MASRIEGRVRLRQVLKILPETERSAISTAIQDGAESMADTMRNLAPIKTGKLKREIRVSPGKERPDLYRRWKSQKIEPDPDLSAIIHADALESTFEEFGTGPHINQGERPGTFNPGQPAQPFFFPGYRARRKDVQAKINKAARQGIINGLR